MYIKREPWHQIGAGCAPAGSFRLHDQFSSEKFSKVFLWNAWNVLTGMHRRKRTLSVYQSRDDQIAIGAKLFDTRYKLYGFIN